MERKKGSIASKSDVDLLAAPKSELVSDPNELVCRGPSCGCAVASTSQVRTAQVQRRTGNNSQFETRKGRGPASRCGQ
eukprot:1738026-Rhodomonas_salina.1